MEILPPGPPPTITKSYAADVENAFIKGLIKFFDNLEKVYGLNLNILVLYISFLDF